MLLALVTAALTAMVVATEPATPGAGSHGAVAGTVTLTDARGETFEAPGVQLTLSCETTLDEPRAATSDEHGVFQFADVRPDGCSLSADLQGFGTVTTNLVVRAAETSRVEIHLDVAPVGTGVRVVAESTCSWPIRRFN
jgi:hypothetical protein